MVGPAIVSNKVAYQYVETGVPVDDHQRHDQKVGASDPEGVVGPRLRTIDELHDARGSKQTVETDVWSVDGEGRKEEEQVGREQRQHVQPKRYS